MAIVAWRMHYPGGILLADFGFLQGSWVNVAGNKRVALFMEMESVFRPNGVILAELDPLAGPLICVGMFATQFCRYPLVALTALESCRRRWRRTEFCDFLVCPEFPLKWRLPCGGVGPTCGTWATPEESVKCFACSRVPDLRVRCCCRAEPDNHAVVGRPHPELRTMKIRIQTLESPAPVLIH